jgi:hypothetical protein
MVLEPRIRSDTSKSQQKMERTMRKGLLTVASILAVGSFAFVSAQAAPTASRTAITADSAIVAANYTHAKRTHHRAVRQTSEITSFSSSSALNVGVNHPAKK